MDKNINKNSTLISKIRTFYDTKIKHVDYLGSIVFLIVLFPAYFITIGLTMPQTTVINIILSGIVQGAFYALIAVGFAIIFGVARLFKLSIGGYFVIGAYSAFWLFKTLYLPFNKMEISSLPVADRFAFSILFYGPIVAFIGLMALQVKLFGRKYGTGISVTNLAFYLIQRSLIVGNYGKVNREATLLAIYVQISILVLASVLYYLELSKKQVIITQLVTNVLGVVLSQFSIFEKSPAVYLAILILSMVITATISMAVDRYILEDIRSQPTNLLIITFGIALLIQSIIPLVRYPEDGEFVEFKVDPRNLDGMVQKFDNQVIFGQPVQTIRIIAAVFSILLLGLTFLFIKYTPMGKAMEAVSEDPEAAWLVGINVRKVYMVATGLGMGLSAAAGVLTSPISATPSWGPYMGWTPLIFAIAVVTLGGIGSIFGSVIAGFIVGFTEVTISSVNIQLSKIVPLIVIMLIIIIRPTGLFGSKEESE